MLDKEKILNRYREGVSPYQIAEEMGTYTQKIRRILIKANEPLRNKSEAQKIAIETGRSTHPTAGRARTDEEKMSISNTLVNSWSNISEEEREKRRATSKKLWSEKSKDEVEQMRAKASVEIRKASREGSKLEKEVQAMLKLSGFVYEAHKKEIINTQKFEIDLFLPSIRTIIEVDGLSHFEPIWGHDQLAKQQRFDAQKEGLMIGRGFNVIRIENLGSSLAISKLEKLKKELLAILEDIKVNNITGSTRTIKYE